MVHDLEYILHTWITIILGRVKRLETRNKIFHNTILLTLAWLA